MTDDFTSERLWLSPPAVDEQDVSAVAAAMRSGWAAPLGPEVDGFESDMAAMAKRRHAVALSSGTAALHLGLLGLGVKPGDDVIVPTLTFAATAFAVTYVGATPIFIDVEPASWTLDPNLLADVLSQSAASGRLPAAVVPVDLFGRTCDYDAILPLCEHYGVRVLVDSAESLGAWSGSDPAGSQGEVAVFSFNGNKIITTSGGGMLVTDDQALAHRARRWATQSREPMPWYEHEEVGYNYRMSNLLAALGRSQLARLPEVVERRREIRSVYADSLASTVGVSVLGDPGWGRWNGWLTTATFDLDNHPGAPTRIREALDRANIESRPIWKPMHQQPVFAQSKSTLTGVADRAFEAGLCLPSGSTMTNGDVERVSTIISSTLKDR
jgi:dTDP-4-amino-4,6-dideoxygalactose transaminase